MLDDLLNNNTNYLINQNIYNLIVNGSTVTAKCIIVICWLESEFIEIEI